MISRNQQILHRKKAQSQKSKRIIKELSVSVSRPEDYKSMTTSDDIKEMVFDSLLYAVSEGIKDNKKSDVELFRIKDTSSSLNIERNNWKKGLSNAIDFFADKQKYEEATKCRDLIKVIDEK